jgi:CHRD domain
MKRRTTAFLGTSALALVAAASIGAGSASAHPQPSGTGADRTVSLSAQLDELNNSGASGTATATVRNQKIQNITVDAHGLTPDAPHAQHIHYGEQALNECPGLDLDSNMDGRINTVEGIPAYGPVVVSLNTTGDTTPASFLDVSRFPVSHSGSYSYSRDNIDFTRVAGTGYTGGGGTAKQIADAIRAGEGVVVIHGVDYNGNGVYDFEGAGASELDPSLPAEATDPAVCGLLKVDN